MIAYRVLSFEPFQLTECTAPSGAICGAVFLDRGFKLFLQKRIGGRADSILTPRRISEALRSFETIKRSFDPFDPDCEEEYFIPLSGARDVIEVGLEDGYLKLFRSFLSSLSFIVEMIFKVYLILYLIRYWS